MRTIPMTPVTSSNIKAVGHDAKSQTLAVHFLSGPNPTYFGPVPAEIAAQLAIAVSVGEAFGQLIRGKWHPMSPDQVAKALADETETEGQYEGSTAD